MQRERINHERFIRIILQREVQPGRAARQRRSNRPKGGRISRNLAISLAVSDKKRSKERRLQLHPEQDLDFADCVP